jgi:hypothetical protein
LNTTFAAPGRVGEKGDEVDIDVASARRMVARGLASRPQLADDAAKRAFDQATKMTPEERGELVAGNVTSDPGEAARRRMGIGPDLKPLTVAPPKPPKIIRHG